MHSRNTILLAIVLVLAVQTLALFAFQNPALSGELNGPDSYMRLRRVLHLFETGNWYDAFDVRTNAPYGELIHWTRLLDVILYAGAWIGSAVTNFRDALFVWGTLVGPALLLVLVPIWSWGTRPYLSPAGFILSLAMLPLLGLLNGTLRAGNPDHHGLIAVLFLAMLALVLRVVGGHAHARAAFAAGVLAGTAIWVGIVEVLAATYFGSALALLWLWRGAPHDRHLSAYVLGLLAAITVALAIERPPGDWLAPFYERLSVVHWFVAAAVAASWFAAQRFLPGRNAGWRLAGLAVTGVVSVGAIALVFPQFFQAPLADGGSPLIDAWLATNLEFESIWPSDRATAQIFLPQVGPALIALAYIAVRWKRSSPELRNVFSALLLGYLFYLPLGLSAIRWISFVQALTLLPFAMAVVSAWRSRAAIMITRRSVRIGPTAAFAVLFSPIFAGAVVAGTAPAASSTDARSPATAVLRAHQNCDVPAISRYLADRFDAGRSNQILFTYLNWGAELVWRTPYSVVGAPYTNVAALNDTSRLFHATTDAAAADVVRARGIDLILVCTESFERYTRGGAENLHNRLVAQQPPDWLVPIELPDPLAATFRLYRVDDQTLPR